MQIDTTLQQVKDVLSGDSVKNVLVTSGKNIDPDAIGSALALAQALEQLGKTVTVAIEGYEPGRYAFLPGVDRISGEVGQKSLVVSIDIATNPIEKINYNAEGTTFNLMLTPKEGQVDVDQIHYSYTGLQYDAILVVDTAKKSLLGDWVGSFTEELKDIPLINIDHHADNEQFGTLNLVRGEAPAAAVVVKELIESLGMTMSQEQATNLLAGLMSDTGGFNNANANAQAMRTAADLVDAGADLQMVMRNLFKTMSVPALRLASRVLGTLEEFEPGIVVAEIRQADVEASGASEADNDMLEIVTNGLIPSVAGGKVSLILKEKDNNEIGGSLRSIDPSIDVRQIAQKFNGGGHLQAAGFRVQDGTIESVRERVVAAIQASLAPLPSSGPDEKKEDSSEESQGVQ